MPNHCYQQVHIRGPREIVKEIYEHLELANPVFCQLIKPMMVWLNVQLPHGTIGGAITGVQSGTYVTSK